MSLQRILRLEAQNRQLCAKISRLEQIFEKINLKPSPDRPKETSATLLYFDLETTGLGKTHEIGICEIGVVCGTTGEVVFQKYVQPFCPVTKKAEEIHELKAEFLEQQLTWEKIGKQLNEKISSLEGDVILAGFCSKRYDSRILTFAHQRNNLKFPPNLYFVDMKEVYPTFYTIEGKKSLGNYHLRASGKQIVSAHNAISDSLALFNISSQIEDQSELMKCIESKMETVAGVHKRCFKR